MTESEQEGLEAVEAEETTQDEPGFLRFGDDSPFLRVAVAVTLLGLVLIVLAGIFIDYRARVVRSAAVEAAKTEAARAVKPSKPATPAVTAPAKPKPVAGSTILVLIDGVNFRESPSGSSKILSTLNKDDKLTFIEQSGSWYHASTSDGVRGWLTSSSQYVKRQ